MTPKKPRPPKKPVDGIKPDKPRLPWIKEAYLYLTDQEFPNSQMVMLKTGELFQRKGHSNPKVHVYPAPNDGEIFHDLLTYDDVLAAGYINNESVVNDIVDTIMSDIARTANQLVGDNSNAQDLSAGDTLGTISYNIKNFTYNSKNGECECLLTLTFGAKDHPAAVDFSEVIKWKNEGELTHRVPEVVGTLAGAFNQYRGILWSIFTSVGQLAHIPFNFKPFAQLNPPVVNQSGCVGPVVGPLVNPCVWPQQGGIPILTAPNGSNGK